MSLTLSQADEALRRARTAHSPTLPLPRTPRPTAPARSEHAAVIRDIARDLLADLERTDYGALSEWDTVELVGRTIAVLGDLLDTDGGR